MQGCGAAAGKATLASGRGHAYATGMDAAVPFIESRQNPRVKYLVKLREGHTRRKLKRFLIEGARELQHALVAGIKLEDGFICPELFADSKRAKALSEKLIAQGTPLTRLSRSAFEKSSLREGPDGILAVGIEQAPKLDDLRLSETPLLLIVEAVEKPGNLGALLRTADAAGVDAVVCCDPVTDRYNPNVIRSSQGLVFALPVVVADREEVADYCRKEALRTIATTPHSESNYFSADLRGSLALLLGSEKDGLSSWWLENADVSVRIPMAGQADSLNVSTAAAVVLFEAVRQRATG